jgi:hypothetical protein
MTVAFFVGGEESTKGIEAYLAVIRTIAAEGTIEVSWVRNSYL